jgi:hypothetical protein
MVVGAGMRGKLVVWRYGLRGEVFFHRVFILLCSGGRGLGHGRGLHSPGVRRTVEGNGQEKGTHGRGKWLQASESASQRVSESASQQSPRC